MNTADLINRKTVAVTLGIDVRTLERMQRKGMAPPRFRVGGQWRYSREELTKWLDEQKMRQSATGCDDVRQRSEVA